WDVSLYEVLSNTGLDVLIDEVVISAKERVSKPNPEIFHRALARLSPRVPPREVVHIGDTAAVDSAGALSAGLNAIHLARDGAPGPEGVPSVQSLAELPSIVRSVM